jgi:hypothetical protein
VVCRPPPMTVMSGSVTGMGTRQLGVSAGEAVAGEAVAAVGRGLVRQETGTDGSFELLMCFCVVFFNLPMVGLPPTSGRFFYFIFHMSFCSVRKKILRENY